MLLLTWLDGSQGRSGCRVTVERVGAAQAIEEESFDEKAKTKLKP